MSEPINANPKIISLEDLPTREAASDITSSANSKAAAFPSSALDSVFPISRSSLDEAYAALLLIAEKKDADGDVEMKEEEAPVLSSGESESGSSDDDEDFEDEEPIDEQEIYDLIASISDPEHPLTLGQLAVVNKPDIHITRSSSADSRGRRQRITRVKVEITPTITHCSLATLIGLGIRVRLERCLPPRYRVEINVKKGTHQSESQVNRQLNDKERVAAACENQQLVGVLSGMLATCK
ncbi:protein FAM96B [Myxozyma melibiosi]|uniref:Protein FAM96B n=1 Tax=Myxozyma melibiosi TaxID=54550 RepID=A0ABR1F9Z9_9ASCO